VISIDQEGGRVARLRGEPWAPVPPMRAYGDLPDAEERVRRLAALLARELRAVGVDLDFAPVLDVDTNPDNPVIGDRSFSRDPRRVARLSCLFIESLQRGGVAACGKHFPGHGDTETDSHFSLPRVPHSRQRLEEVELVPFRAAVDAEVAAMMTAHVVCDALDPDLPATMSANAVGYLRRDLRFDGVVIGDDLEMHAVTDRWPVPEAACTALAAGCDHVLVCSRTDLVPAAVARVEEALAHGELEADQLRESIERWETLATRYARPAAGTEGLAWLRSADHRRRVDEVMAGLA
jgi:beta-N-acetylhexosaminidase